MVFVFACLFFNSSRSLLIDSCIFSILPWRLLIFSIIILNSSGNLPIFSSFIWTYVFLVWTFISVVFLCLFRGSGLDIQEDKWKVHREEDARQPSLCQMIVTLQDHWAWGHVHGSPSVSNRGFSMGKWRGACRASLPPLHCTLVHIQYMQPNGSVQFSHSVVSNFWDPMNCSTPGLPVYHQLPGPTQTHIHWVGDAI